MVSHIDIHKIKRGDAKEFRLFFESFYPRLMTVACRYVPEFVAEDVVQNVFVRYWEQKQTLEPDNVKAFLFKCIQNGCLDYLKHRAVMDDYEHEVLVAEERLNWLLAQTDRNEIWDDLVMKDLSASVKRALEKLPQRCSEAFRLSFYEDLTYKEIAERMNISPRTVEEHVQKAIRVLRVELKDVLILWLLLFHLFRFWG